MQNVKYCFSANIKDQKTYSTNNSLMLYRYIFFNNFTRPLPERENEGAQDRTLRHTSDLLMSFLSKKTKENQNLELRLCGYS